MIISAAVKILLKRENREITIPCHRHGDAYKILKDLGFQPSDFETVKQGFIAYVVDPDKRINWIETFLDRKEALAHAKRVHQISTSISEDELCSDDLY